MPEREAPMPISPAPQHGLSPEHGEQEHSRKSVWIIDDNEDLPTAMIRSATAKGDIGVDFFHYQLGEEAIAAFSQFVDQKGQLPNVILMDYKLDEDVVDPKYRRGTDVITELRRVSRQKNVRLPEIIAFSSDKAYAKELIQAGARKSLDKSSLSAINDWLKNL